MTNNYNPVRKANIDKFVDRIDFNCYDVLLDGRPIFINKLGDKYRNIGNCVVGISNDKDNFSIIIGAVSSSRHGHLYYVTLNDIFSAHDDICNKNYPRRKIDGSPFTSHDYKKATTLKDIISLDILVSDVIPVITIDNNKFYDPDKKHFLVAGRIPGNGGIGVRLVNTMAKIIDVLSPDDYGGWFGDYWKRKTFNKTSLMYPFPRIYVVDGKILLSIDDSNDLKSAWDLTSRMKVYFNLDINKTIANLDYYCRKYAY